MLKFFRKIRQQMLTENKLSKYLLYAIGEIVLVVIGILIALQINNWNTDRIKRQDEIKYYQNIRHQIIDDLKEVEKVRDINTYFSAQFEYANQIISAKDRSKIDTLALMTMNLSQYSDFHRSVNIYETLVNSGDLKLLKNTEIPTRLQRLEETYTYINKLEDIHWEIIMKEISTEMRGVLNYATLQIEKPEKLYSVEIQNIFVECIYLMKGKDFIYNRAIGEMSSIIELINDELNPRLVYEEVGMVGSALASGWEKSVPMHLINQKKSIWKLDITLKKGEVKFRAFDNWIQNWGGESFPSGHAKANGENILVEAGNYYVVLNLADETYEFSKIED